MKKVTKFFMVALLAGMCSSSYAQSQPDYMKAPKPDEKIIGTLDNYKTSKTCKALEQFTYQEIYQRALSFAKDKYSNYGWIDLRNTKITCNSDTGYDDNDVKYIGDETYFVERATLNCSVVTNYLKP